MREAESDPPLGSPAANWGVENAEALLSAVILDPSVKAFAKVASPDDDTFLGCNLQRSNRKAPEFERPQHLFGKLGAICWHCPDPFAFSSIR
jgi:hypothetical protein